MSAFLGVLAEEPALRYAVNLALGAAVVSLMGLVFAKVAQKNAPLRQGLLAATLITLAVLLLLALPLWRGGLLRVSTAPPPDTIFASASAPAGKATGETVSLPSAPQGSRSASAASSSGVQNETPTPSAFSPMKSLIWGGLCIWMAGSVLGAMMVVRSLLSLRRLLAGSMDAGPEWQERVQWAAETVGVTPVPQVGFTSGSVVPFALGGRQPRILLPEAVRTLEVVEAEAILLHECGHLVHHHSLLGVMMVAVGVLYWWLPPVRWVNSVLADAMEEVCDNHVVAAQGNGHALGRCLVWAAETATGVRMLAGAAILHSKRGMSRRLARVLEADMNRDTKLTRFGRLMMIFTALTCLGVCALMRVAPSEAQNKPESWEAYFPLAVGTEWRYRETYTVNKDQKVSREGVTRIRRQIPIKGGGTCAEFEAIREENNRNYFYFGLRKDGYYQYHSVHTIMPGVDENAPSPYVRFPVQAGTTWKWHEAYRQQVLTNEENRPDTSTWGSDYTATVEQADEEITVPAGKYRTIRVRLQCKSQHNGDHEQVIWYAKGVGTVRHEFRLLRPQQLSYKVELVTFTPGAAKADTGKTAPKAGSEPRKLRDISLPGGAIRSRFVVAEGGPNKHVLYRVVGQKLTTFDTTRLADWNRLFTEDKVTLPSFSRAFIRQPLKARMAMAQSLARDMGNLIAESQGFTTDANTAVNEIAMNGNDHEGGQIRFTVNGVPNDRVAWSVKVDMEVSQQGEVIRLKAEPKRQ